MSKKIVYELTKIFHVYAENIGEIEFELQIPKQFPTPQEAALAESFYSAHMRKKDDGRVFIAILEKQKERGAPKEVDRIYWEDHRKYRCIITKKESAEKKYIDDSDFVPCALEFSRIFDLFAEYLRNSNKTVLGLEEAAYDVRPAFEQPASKYIDQNKNCDDIAELVSLVTSCEER